MGTRMCAKASTCTQSRRRYRDGVTAEANAPEQRSCDIMFFTETAAARRSQPPTSSRPQSTRLTTCSLTTHDNS
eukprot:scaffold31949_cov146-Isochrysis_galbana.AAC.1